MNPTIIASVIGGFVALVVPILTLIAKDWYEGRKFTKDKTRRDALVGTWRGPMKQAIGRNGPFETVATIKFTEHGKKIIGKATYTSGEAEYELDFVGGFLHEQFVKLDYNNPDSQIMQFGCYVARLDITKHSKILDGRFVGYGPDTR